MSKQRPSSDASDDGRRGLRRWARRLFKNSYTRAGRRIRLRGWSVKLQHGGRRHTFPLSGATRKEAAVEAKAIYETLRAEGWDAALGNRRRWGAREEGNSRREAAYWKERLLLRRYHFAPSGEAEHDLAVRIDHAGQGYFFPLGTADPDAAAARAQRIYWTVVERGWETVIRQFPRELIVGFEWCSNPVMWTYTTIHTLIPPGAGEETARARRNAQLSFVMVVDADAGVRRALCWCVDQHPATRGIPCESAAAFNGVFAVRRPQMVLLNHNQAGRLGLNATGQVALLPSGVPALAYSTCTDGDQLFVSTPGGSQGYLLRRVKPTRLLEPIFNDAGQPDFTGAGLLERVRTYFKTLLQPPSGHDLSLLARLTRREREVLDLLSKGCVDKEIAQSLGISAWTVHDHIKNIFERLHVRTRTEAVVRYLEK
jgi:DNA-binding NarL/FixJ family response regulator